MKLPQYDNRRDTPLYTDPDAGKGNFKWPTLVLIIVVGFFMCFLVLGYGVIEFLSNVLRFLSR